jgi:type IV pilus assembly protein PilW
MVALVLGLVLTAAAISLYVGHRQSFAMIDALSEVKQTGRFALRTLGRDLRMAGHLACANPGGWHAALVHVDPGSSLAGLQYPAQALAVEDQDADGEPDTLVVRYAAAETVALASDMGSASADIELAADLGIEAEDPVVIADCGSADLFEVQGQGGATLGHNGLAKAYAAGQTEVMRYVEHRYRVVDTGATTAAGDAIRALERNGQVLVRGIEHMHVQFGECTDPDGRIHRDWSDPAVDPARITSVRIGFLVRSRNRVREDDDSTVYVVAGARVHPDGSNVPGPRHAGDRRLRQVHATTVAVRNRPQGGCNV